jgi:hypothetical protein
MHAKTVAGAFPLDIMITHGYARMNSEPAEAISTYLYARKGSPSRSPSRSQIIPTIGISRQTRISMQTESVKGCLITGSATTSVMNNGI